MNLATQAPPTDDGGDDGDDGEDDGLSAGIIVLIVVLVTLLVLTTLVVFVVYVVYRGKRKSKYDIYNHSKQHRNYGGACYIADNTAQQTQSSQVQEMVSTEPELLKEKSLKEDTADDNNFVVEVNLDAADDDKDTHL